MYFGDNERGHVLSHTFSLQDSLARGFYRKYCIIVLMKDKVIKTKLLKKNKAHMNHFKVYLLNAWHILRKHIKEVVEDLQKHAKIVNGTEQEKQSQRAFRQAQTSPTVSTRSLSQLTGQPAVFAHIHLWFCWILNIKIASEQLKFPTLSVNNLRSCSLLRAIFQDMGEEIFNTALYCCLTGIQIDCESSLYNSLKSLLPNDWPELITTNKCKIYKLDNKWTINWNESLPNKLPTLHVQCIKALKDYRLPDDALEIHLQALIYQWQNITQSLCYCPNYDKQLLQSFAIQICDIPLLTYWIYNCCNSIPKHQIIIENLKKVLNNR